MTATVNPTNEQIYEQLQYNTGRISAVQKEVIRRLEVNLPGAIDYVNDMLGYTEAELSGIPKPLGYYVAPSSMLTDDYINTILVGVEVTTSANGPGQFKNQAEVIVYSVDQRIEHATQVEDTFDRADIVRAVLLCFLNGCVDPEDRQVWRLMAPTGHRLALPAGWGDTYSGSTATFTVVQDQNCACWV